MRFEPYLRWATAGLFGISLGLAVTAVTIMPQLEARLLKTPPTKQVTWRVIEADEIEAGVTIPPGTNVVLHLPATIPEEGILREVLFGNRGRTVRYWGYVFPKGQTTPSANTYGFAGKMFLSEAERWAQEDAVRAKTPAISLFNPPASQSQLTKAPTRGLIRHQVEVFYPGDSVYVMTSKELPVGTDADGDGANSKMEEDALTDVQQPDTDEDGLSDGIEIRSGTNPTLRDTDNDGLIDGLEDKNANGRLDAGETDPRSADSDKDGLCDGLCNVSEGGRKCWEFSHTTDCTQKDDPYWGEDRNLNGQVDGDETNPLKWSTYDDGVNDYQRYLNGLLQEAGSLNGNGTSESSSSAAAPASSSSSSDPFSL